MRKLLRSCLTVLALLAAAPVALLACEPCQQDYLGGTQFHRFNGDVGDDYMCGSEGCHGTWSEYFCDSDAHDPCGATEEDLELSPEEFFAAVEAQDLGAIRSVLDGAADRIALNRGRRHIQFLDCTGRITASLAVNSASWDTLVEALE